MTEGPPIDLRTQAILEVLRTLPEQSLAVTISNPRGSTERTFHGALLLDYAVAAGIMPKAGAIGGFGSYYFVAEAADGFRVALSVFEAAERFSGKKVLLAWEQDGEPVRTGVRLVVPGDHLGGRSIGGVVSLVARQVEWQSIGPRETSAAFTVGGVVKQPLTLTLTDLGRFPEHDVETVAGRRRGDQEIPPRRYRGVLLWDILEEAGFVLEPGVNEDILQKVIALRSSDGFAAVIAAGEIQPRFMKGDVIIATDRDEESTAESEDGLRVVIPYDRSVARSLKSLANIEVRQA